MCKSALAAVKFNLCVYLLNSNPFRLPIFHACEMHWCSANSQTHTHVCGIHIQKVSTSYSYSFKQNSIYILLKWQNNRKIYSTVSWFGDCSTVQFSTCIVFAIPIQCLVSISGGHFITNIGCPLVTDQLLPWWNTNTDFSTVPFFVSQNLNHTLKFRTNKVFFLLKNILIQKRKREEKKMFVKSQLFFYVYVGTLAALFLD